MGGDKRAFLIGALVLLFLAITCGGGMAAYLLMSRSATPPPVPGSTDPVVSVTDEQPRLVGCWDGDNSFYECFRSDGSYVYGQDGREAVGVWRANPATAGVGAQVTIDAPEAGGTTYWRVQEVTPTTLMLFGQTPAGVDRQVRYTRRPDPMASPTPAPTVGPNANDRLVGCWVRVDGGVSECYRADGTYTAQRSHGPLHGTWRRDPDGAMQLTIPNGTFRYTVTFGPDGNVTFVGGGGTETFRPAPQ